MATVGVKGLKQNFKKRNETNKNAGYRKQITCPHKPILK